MNRVAPASDTARLVDFLGVMFTPLDLEAATARIVARASARGQGFAYVATPNVDHIVKLHHDPVRRGPLYQAAWLRLNDSRILEGLARASGLSLPAAPGSDIAARLFETVIRPDEPVTLIGADAALVQGLQARYGLRQVHWHSPPMGLAENPEAIAAAAAFVAAHPARFVFLCVGAPQQEMVAKAILERGDGVGVGLCVGAALAFLSGQMQRAPRWMRAARLEWLHRLGAEPGRLWRRYLVEGPEILSIWLRWRRGRGRPS